MSDKQASNWCPRCKKNSGHNIERRMRTEWRTIEVDGVVVDSYPLCYEYFPYRCTCGHSWEVRGEVYT